MRTNIVIDDQLMSEAFRYTHAKTKKEVVHIALKEFVENARRLSLLDIKGRIKLVDDYDYKELRDSHVSD